MPRSILTAFAAITLVIAGCGVGFAYHPGVVYYDANRRPYTYAEYGGGYRTVYVEPSQVEYRGGVAVVGGYYTPPRASVQVYAPPPPEVRVYAPRPPAVYVQPPQGGVYVQPPQGGVYVRPPQGGVYVQPPRGGVELHGQGGGQFGHHDEHDGDGRQHGDGDGRGSVDVNGPPGRGAVDVRGH